MPTHLCISIRFLQPYSHGRGEDAQPEWPPSPLRLFQALVAGSAGRWNERKTLTSAAPALKWLEIQQAPQIVAGGVAGSHESYRLFVPDNVADKVAVSWCNGRDADIAGCRVEKDVRSVSLSGDAVHYLYPLPNGHGAHLEVLALKQANIER